jgi:beta-N-acetylhexosaminidase
MPSAASALHQGIETGAYLRRLGIALDLAPVLDSPTSARAFIFSRAFSTDPRIVATRGTAFARGLLHSGIAAAVKHFPGLGRLQRSTDYGPALIGASRAALDRDLGPFRTAVRAGVPVVMVGTAIYPAYGSRLPAACAQTIVGRLLRRTLGFNGVVISDDLDSAAVWPSLPTPEAAVHATQAGVDMLYVAGLNGSGGDAIGEETYVTLLRAARDGRVSDTALRASYTRIAALKSKYVQH